MNNIITLLSDFGIADHYVSAMKGAILSINPKATIVDISHQVPPQDIAQAAYLLDNAWRYFPKGAIHLIVVDPGVGSQRKIVILQHPQAFFVAPDNGVLSYVLAEEKRPARSVSYSVKRVKLSAGLRAMTLSNRRFWRSEVSNTFQGRDIMAPVAAHLSRGVPLEEFGEPITELMAFPVLRPRRSHDALTGHIIHIDSFGNLITDVRSADLPSRNVSIEVAGHHIQGLVRYYAQKDGLVALIGSSDRLEIALRNGSAAAFTGAKVGDEVVVRFHR